MMVTQHDAGRCEWLHRALCRRYASVVFTTVAVPSLPVHDSQSRTICWALGCLINGESEILGVWSWGDGSGAAAMVVDALHERGVEDMRCVSGGMEGNAPTSLERFRSASLYPSIEQSITLTMAGVRAVHREAMRRLLWTQVCHPDGEPDKYVCAPTSSEDLWQKYPAILTQWPHAVAAFKALVELPQPYRRLVVMTDQAAGEIQDRLTRSLRRRGAFANSTDAFDFVADWLMRADLRLERDQRALHLRDERDTSKPRRAISASVAAAAPALG